MSNFYKRMNNRLYTIQEVANILGVSTKTLRRWDQRGRFVPTRTVGNQRRYTQEQIDTFSRNEKSTPRIVRGPVASLPPASSPSSGATPLFDLESSPKHPKANISLPSILSGLPSNSFLRHHFLLKHKEAISIESQESSKESLSFARPGLAKLEPENTGSTFNPVKLGFMFAGIVLFLSFAGAMILVKYNVVAGLSHTKDQFAKFIENLPQISLLSKDRDQNGDLSFVPQENLVGSVLAAEDGESDLLLRISVPVIIGGEVRDPSAIFEIGSVDQGFLAPRMTGDQVDAITAPAAGLFVYNTDTNHYNMYNGTAWEGVGTITSIGDVITGDAFTATGSQGTSLYFYDAEGRGQLTIANLTGVRTFTLPDASGEISLLGQTISNAELVNSKVTVSPGTNMTGGGEVALGSSITLTLKDSITLAGTLTVAGETLLNGNVGIGDAITDPITFTGRVAVGSDLIPIGTTGTNDLGTALLPWDNVFADNVFAASSGTSGYWQRNSNALSPTNITDDILIGATSTSSALIKFSGTSGGNSWFNTGNVGIGDTSPSSALEVGDGTDSLQISSVGDITFVDANGTASITGPAGGAFSMVAGSGQALTLTGNAASTWSLSSGALTFNTTSSNIALTTITSGDITLTTAAATGLANILTGNLKVGNGTPTITQDGEDTYLEGVLEVDGISTFGGNVGIGITTPLAALDVRGAATVSGALTVDSTATIQTTNMKDLTIGSSGTGGIALAPAGTTSLYAMNGGNIGIATTTPTTFKLEIAGIIGPTVGGTYDLGSSARRWATVYADTGNFTSVAGVITGGSTNAADWLINADNATADTEDATLTFERGSAATNSQFRWNSTTKQITTNSPSFAIAPDATIAFSGTSALMVNQVQSQDIFTASASAVTRFVLENDGDLILGTKAAPINFLSAVAGGSTVFNEQSADIDFRIESDNNANAFFLDASVDNIGIGTGSPTSQLYVTRPLTVPVTGKALAVFDQIESQDILTASASGTTRFVIKNDGNVGIGMALPTSTLHITSTNAIPLTVASDPGDSVSALALFQRNHVRNAGSYSRVEVRDGTSAGTALGFIEAGSYAGATDEDEFRLRSGFGHIIDMRESFGFRFTIANALTAATGGVVIPAASISNLGSNAPSSMLGILRTDAMTLTGTGLITYANTATIYVEGAPIAGSNVTITAPYALWVDGGTSRFDGNVGFGGQTTPLTELDVTGSASLSANISLRGSGTAHTFNILQNGTLNFTRSPGGDAVSTTSMFIQGDGNVGIGTTSPLTLLDVRGAASASGALTLTTTPTIQSTSNQTLTLGGSTTGNIVLSPINAAGNVFINDTSNANMTAGLTLNQGANDNEIFALKSSDVAHGITDIAETDTYGDLVKGRENDGGVALRGLSEGEEAIWLVGWYTTDNTTKTANGGGGVMADIRKKSGAGEGNPGADANIFAIRSNGSTRLLVDTEGAIFQTPNTTNYGNKLEVTAGGETVFNEQLLNIDFRIEGDNNANAFFLDASVDNIGIGTTSPTSQLYVTRPLTVPVTGKALAVFDQIESQDILAASASGTMRFVIRNDGNVGIGTALPGAMLAVGSSTPALITSAGLVTVANTTDSTSGSTGSINTLGGLGVTKDLAVDGGDIVTAATTFNLINATATTVSFAGAATTALNIGNGNTAYTAINIGSGTGGNTINIAGTGATGADTINIGTGGTSADTINVGSSASTTAFNVTTGTGAQTYTSNVATGTTTTSGFVFDATAITSGTSIYAVSDSVTTGRLLDIATSGNTWTGNGTTNGLINIASTSTGGTASSQSILLNLARSGANANTAHTAYGVYSNVTNTNATSGTNIAAYLSASGATTANYGLIVANGNVGIGTTSPLEILGVTGNATISGTLTVDTVRPETGALSLQYKSGGNAWTTGLTLLDNSGNVGIGTTAPTVKLQVSGGQSGTASYNATGGILLDNWVPLSWKTNDNTSTIEVLQLATSTNDIYLGNDNGAIYFRTSGSSNSTKVAIISDGNVGIGDTSPSSKLEVGDGTDSLQVSSVGDITFVDANGAASITGPAGGILTVTSATDRNLALNAQGTGDISLTIAGSDFAFQQGTNITTSTGDLRLDPSGVLLTNSGQRINFNGGTDTSDTLFHIGGSFTAATSTSVVLEMVTNLTPAVDASGIMQRITPNFTEAASGTHNTFAGMLIDAPTITAAGAATTSVLGLQVEQPRLSNGVGGANSYAIYIGTVTNTLGNTTVTSTDAFGIRVGQVTYTSTTNVHTVTNPASIYIEGAPVASTNVTFTNGPYALWVDAGTSRFDGNVGLGGQATPLTELDVTGSASLSANISLRGSGTAHTFNILDNGTLNIRRSVGGDAAFATNMLFFENSGNIGIGTTAPTAKLHVLTTASTTNPNILFNVAASNNDGGLQVLSSGTEAALSLKNTDTGGKDWQILSTGGSAGGGQGKLQFYNRTDAVSAMFLTSAGNVGIGIGTPLLKLDVQDSQAATAAAQIYNTSTNVDADGLVIKLGNTSTTVASSTNHFVSFETFGIGIVGSVQGSGGKGVTYATSGIADFAEYFRKDASQAIPFGSTVCLKDDGLAVPCDSNNSKIIGVASERPAFLGGENLGDRSIAVGLVGQVRTRVSTANGAIKIGDPLTTSSIPGVAVKATSVGQILGKAIEPFDGAAGQESDILVSVNITWYNPSVYVAMDGTLSGITATVTGVEEQLASQGQALRSWEAQAASASARLSTLEQDTDYVLANDPLFDSVESKLDLLTLQYEQQASISAYLTEIVNSQVLGASTSAVLDLGDIEADNLTVAEDLMVLGRATVTDLGVTGTINAGMIAIHGIDGEIDTLSGDLYLQRAGLGGVNILAGKVVIDTLGNMTVAGTITANAIEANNYTVLGDQSIGSATIPAGSTSIEVNTEIASGSSKIFLTTTSLTDKQITVVEKSDGKFRVAIPQPTTSPISFDWWIVGNVN